MLDVGGKDDRKRRYLDQHYTPPCALVARSMTQDRDLGLVEPLLEIQRAQALFNQLLKALEDWHADGISAAQYDASPGARRPSSSILFLRSYPGPPWRRMWESAAALERRAIIESLKDELYGIAHRREHVQGFSLKSDTDRRRVYLDVLATGSKRHAAKRFGISRDTVRRIVTEHEEVMK